MLKEDIAKLLQFVAQKRHLKILFTVKDDQIVAFAQTVLATEVAGAAVAFNKQCVLAPEGDMEALSYEKDALGLVKMAEALVRDVDLDLTAQLIEDENFRKRMFAPPKPKIFVIPGEEN